jgi:hypothetical protein
MIMIRAHDQGACCRRCAVYWEAGTPGQARGTLMHTKGNHQAGEGQASSE